jgi:hypothetical protein
MLIHVIQFHFNNFFLYNGYEKISKFIRCEIFNNNLNAEIHISRKHRDNIFYQRIRGHEEPHHEKRICHDKYENAE